MEYSVNQGTLSCGMCRHFPSGADDPFVKDGLTDWKHLHQAETSDEPAPLCFTGHV